MFRGINDINLDEKGRLAIPVRYRDPIRLNAENKLIVTIDTEDKCLLIYPVPAWEEIEEKIEALPSFNQVSRRIQRLLIGHATETNLDGSGRILLPQYLREYAGLKKQVILAGQGKKFELWDAINWQKNRNKWLGMNLTSKDMPEDLCTLSL